MIHLRRARPPSRVMTAEEEEHIKKVGRAKFGRAFDLAQFETRKDGHFVGLDKVRNAIAYEAALRATGFRERPLIFPYSAGRADEEGQRVAEELLVRATDFARERTRERLV